MQDIGSFTTTTSVLRITDPCYEKGTWCAGTLDKCATGTWHGFVQQYDAGDWGIRNSELHVLHESVVGMDQEALDSMPWKPCKFEVGVDSGSAGVFEESRYPASGGDDEEFYDRCGKAYLPDEMEAVLHGVPKTHLFAGAIPEGVVSLAGYGDGGYEANYKELDGRVVAVRIIFIDEYEPEDSGEYEELDSEDEQD